MCPLNTPDWPNPSRPSARRALVAHQEATKKRERGRKLRRRERARSGVMGYCSEVIEPVVAVRNRIAGRTWIWNASEGGGENWRLKALSEQIPGPLRGSSRWSDSFHSPRAGGQPGCPRDRILHAPEERRNLPPSRVAVIRGEERSIGLVEHHVKPKVRIFILRGELEAIHESSFQGEFTASRCLALAGSA